MNRAGILLLMAILIGACSSSDSDTTDGSDNVGGTTAANGTDSATGSDEITGCKSDADCDKGFTCVAEVCLVEPGENVIVTNNSVYPSEPDSSKPNLDCVGGKFPTSSGPEKATIYGVVDRFGGGRETYDIEVSVFLADEWPPEECTSLPVAKQRVCFRDIKSPWSTVSKPPYDGSPVEAACENFNHKECPTGYECEEGDLDFACKPQWGLYEIADVPTNTLLVIRSRNDVSNAVLDPQWKDTYVTNVYIHADQVDGDGRTNVNALMVSTSQWTTIPTTLMVPGGIKPTNGAVGGRIRDCRGSERSSFTLGNVSVGLQKSGAALGYFNDNEEETVPLLTRVATDIYGRFAAVDVPSGPNKIVAAMRGESDVVSLGSESIYVVPNSLVVVSFPGKQPVLRK